MPGLLLDEPSRDPSLNHDVATYNDDDDDEPAPSPSDALRLTAFPSWYPFHRSHSPRATVLDLAQLEPSFIPWLESGSFVLPEEPASTLDSGNTSNGNGDDAKEEEGDGDELPPPTFPRLHARLLELIEKYDGAVFPKLTWSAPRDAAWIVPGATLRCTSPSDIYLLLKSSDFVATDIAQARELYLGPGSSSQSASQAGGSTSGSITVDLEAARAQLAALSTSSNAITSAPPPPSPPLHLVIKQHYPFPTSHEFRCFVHRRRLIALSQRDTSTAFPHLQPSSVRANLRRLIWDFWRSHLDLERPAAPTPTPSNDETAEGGSATIDPNSRGTSQASPTALLRDYVFDVYLTRDQSRVFLVDLAPWGIARTDPLLWDWGELEELSARVRARARGTDTRRRATGGSRDVGDEGARRNGRAEDSAVVDNGLADEDEQEQEEDQDEAEGNEQTEDGTPLPPLRILTSDPPSQANSDEPSASASPFATAGAATAQGRTFSNTPTYAHNMVPADFHALASASAGGGVGGKTLEQLREEWAAAVARASVDEDDGGDDGDEDEEAEEGEDGERG